ncbi:hypothetical protein [Cytobacillus gottheilii]|uniref:hypothetical protein n=1 Tax=Cytobacillus gottheilii TaxID=859144 RepID=UPI002494A7A2|nr:hypothetical protein [Cytobacillus gottheilii]
MNKEEHILTNVTPLDVLVGKKIWNIPGGSIDVPTFYSRIENKTDLVALISKNKGFQAFIERTKPRQLVIGGDPIINVAQGQMALLLASGAVNGLIGEGEHLHAVQGMELVTKIITEEKSEHSTVTKSRTKRDVSVKIITPGGKVKKLV